VSGIDHARAAMITAVLDKHAKLPVGAADIYLSTVGGMRLTDPSTDLAVAIALASAYAGLPLPATTVVVGEVGLAGDLRPISGMDRRLAEAARLGFTTALTPPGAPATVGELRTVAAANIVAALHHLVDIADHGAGLRPPPRLLDRS
ncbi:MAG: magnesium chelatase domain-containing protein, partial [Mycolicibacter algericus]